MSRYLEIKPGSISEVAKKLREDYEAYFKKELEKEGKSLASMTDAEKKAFFNRVDKGYNAKDEATSQDISPSMSNKPVATSKTTLVAAPGGKEKVIRIPVEKLADYKAKGYVEAEEFVPEAAKEPYAIGMAAAMKSTGDTPPLKKSTIIKAHDIAKKIEKNEELTAAQKKLPPALQKAIDKKEKNEDVDADKMNKKQRDIKGEKEPVKFAKYQESTEEVELNESTDINFKPAISIDDLKKYGTFSGQYFILTGTKQKMFVYKTGDKITALKITAGNRTDDKDSDKADMLINKIAKDMKYKKIDTGEADYHFTKEEVKLDEAGMKEIDTNKKELERLNIRLSNLKDKKNANAGGDTTDVEKQIKQTEISVIDLKKKLSATKTEEVETVEEAAGPDRLTNLNDKITKLQVNISKLDMSKPESKTKEAIMKADLTTAKLRLQDAIQKKNTETKKESVNEAKKNYKNYKKSLKKEEENPKNMKKTLTGQPVTKIDVEPKLAGHN